MPWANVMRNVMLPLTLARMQQDRSGAARGRDGRARRAQGVREGLSARAFRRHAMRVSIARALVTRPSILLMDEPFAALDEITRHKLNDDLLALWWKQRFTVVFVTHSVFESVYLSQRIVVMAARPGRDHGRFRRRRALPARQPVSHVGRIRTASAGSLRTRFRGQSPHERDVAHADNRPRRHRCGSAAGLSSGAPHPWAGGEHLARHHRAAGNRDRDAVRLGSDGSDQGYTVLHPARPAADRADA